MNFAPCRLGWTAVLVLCLSQASGAVDRWPLWEAYKNHFLSAEGRIVDRDAGDRTTSEGQAYALFFSLVANDRRSFDSILNWTETNLAQGDLRLHLPAWLWAQAPDGSWRVQDANSASDADLWIAYTLVEAGEAWHDSRYSTLGKALAVRISEREVVSAPGWGVVLLPGPEGFQPAQNVFVLNPSYMPFPLVARLAKMSSAGTWAKVAEDLPSILVRSRQAGFAMDWIQIGPGDQVVASSGPGTRACGSYDAIRVYAWAGMTPEQMPGRDHAIESLSGMRNYLKNHDQPPACISPDGVVLDANGPIGFSAALVPFLRALGESRLAQIQENRVFAERLKSTGLFGKQQRYYDQNLIMFSQGWSERRFHFDREGRLRLGWKK